MDLLSRWYKTRNAPGPANMSSADEWNMFCQCVLEKLGYAVDKLKLNCSGGGGEILNASLIFEMAEILMKTSMIFETRVYLFLFQAGTV